MSVARYDLFVSEADYYVLKLLTCSLTPTDCHLDCRVKRFVI